jgi:hypothetical protein
MVMLAETLLSDREHRAIWNGPAMPGWQSWPLLFIVLAACLVCLWDRSRSLWTRGFALCFLFLSAFFFLTHVIVAEHHLVVLVPLAAVVTVLGLGTFGHFFWGRVAVTAIALGYLGSAVYWQAAAVRGTAKSGGVGQWSDAVFALSEYLQRKYPIQEIKILDWGLADNLFVLSDGRIHLREVYGDITSSADPRWAGEIRRGGVFLINGPANRQIPAATAGFLDALAAAHPRMGRYTIPQRSGIAYATVIEIEPNSVQDSLRPTSAIEEIDSKVLTGDPRYADRLEGFNQIEPGGWRWTRRAFAVTLRAPGGSGQAGARLTLQLYIPESSIQKLGPMTLTARLGDVRVGSETYTQAGDHTFARDLAPGWLKAGVNRVAFDLDKWVPAGSGDGRELGIVVSSASLEAR